MRISIRRTLSGGDVGCTTKSEMCGGHFVLGNATAWAVRDDGTPIGEVCPRCLDRGPESMMLSLEMRAVGTRRMADALERWVDEGLGEVPGSDELRMLDKVYGSPATRR